MFSACFSHQVQSTFQHTRILVTVVGIFQNCFRQEKNAFKQVTAKTRLFLQTQHEEFTKTKRSWLHIHYVRIFIIIYIPVLP